MTEATFPSVRSRLAQLLREAAADADAIEFDDRWWTWGGIQATARALEDALSRAGLGAGARVGLVLENRPEHVAALAQLLGSGRCTVTLNPLQPPERLSADIARSDLPVLVAGPEILDRPGVRGAVSGLVLSLNPDGTVSPVAGTVPTGAEPAVGVGVEMWTSGTTGPPKRVRLSDRQMDSVMAASGQAPKPGRLLGEGVGIVTTPLVHIGGLWGALAGLYAGRRIVLLPRFDIERWVSAVERYRPQATGLVPTAMRAVLAADVPPERLAGLKVITSGAAPCPPEIADEFFRRYGARVLMVYGATEFAGAVAGWTLPMHREWWERKKGSVGRPYPGVELRVVSPDGEVLPLGTTGIVEVRSNQSPTGAAAWQPTSDLGQLDEDGFLWLRGRSDDAIIRGGFKVHPDVVARALERHPSVREAAVAPLPDDRLGQVPVAAVELYPGAARPEPAELIALAREELTPYEVPTRVLVVDELPRSAALKVSRPDLLALFTAEDDGAGSART